MIDNRCLNITVQKVFFLEFLAVWSTIRSSQLSSKMHIRSTVL